MPQKRPTTRAALSRIDPAALAEFQAGIRKRYSNEDILEQLRACAERLGRSPTMREFEEDSETSVHPQTVIQHFGTWNASKREAGLVPRRFAQPADLIKLLRALGDELGRPPTAKDLDEHRSSMPSKSLYWHMFGSLKNALRQAGFDVPVGEERLERAIEQGIALALTLGHLPKFADWAAARRKDSELMSEWQVYRMLEPGGGVSGPAGQAGTASSGRRRQVGVSGPAGQAGTASSGRRRQVGVSGPAGQAGTASSGRRRQVGAWATFQYLVRERLLEDGVEVSAEGVLKRRRSPQGGSGRKRPRPARAQPGEASPRTRGRA